MAQPIAINAINEILGSRQQIATYLQGIRIYLNGLSIHDDNARRVDIPNHIERAFNNITDELNTIINHADIAY